jgi:deazaflavin-dependent oxidoreductase (nitroreductase family)
VAHPDVVITHRRRRRELRARLASAEEKADLWPVCDAHYAGYATYRQRTDRDIPIFVCEPFESTGS